MVIVPPPNELCGIPGLGLVPDQEIRRYTSYIQNLGPAALKSSPTEAINIEHFFWTAFAAIPFQILSVAQGVIFIPQLALPMLERSFSLYNTMLSERRRNLSESSLKLVFLYNNFVGKDFS
ncbi:hat family dimerization domain [Plakobranchus ocellatus]|uniref:Hat family dimerization domain n=1 Tax=Plakobranchus ocellatus TaxID=259542 RepID=A0AAV4DNS6_9GAST|nr:hat family dimerization domain [Plakobranchus ocellatus]